MDLTAHVLWQGGGNFFNGAAHPLVTPPHLLAVCAGALAAGRSGEDEAKCYLGGFASVATVVVLVPWYPAGGPGWFLTGGAAVFAIMGAAGVRMVAKVSWFAGAWTASWMFWDCRDELDDLSFLAGVAAGALLVSLLVAGLAKMSDGHSPAGRVMVRVLLSWIGAVALLELAVGTGG